jgi:two-component system nitrogen regulation response regulator GlnG
LENLMRRLAALHAQETITAEVVDRDLAEAAPATEEDGSAASEPLTRAMERHIRQFLTAHEEGLMGNDIYDRVIAEVERPLIQLTLLATRGNQIKAAAMLGLNRNTLRKKIRDLDVPVVRGVA